MRIAQDLFESGLITYHRTSSTYVSSTGIGIALKYLESKGLSEYKNPSHWGSPGAHEAIRPTYPVDAQDLEKAVAEGLITPTLPLSNLHYRVYDMIFKRFIASQMKPYVVERRIFKLAFPGIYEVEIAVDTGIVEHGFDLVVKPLVYPALKSVDEVVVKVTPVAKYVASTKPLYSEGEVVFEMKKQGLGRPSTYAKIIENLVKHGYVVKSEKRGFLIPTKTGIEVYNYLTRTFPELTSVELTRRMEKTIDLIESGQLDSGKALEDLINTVTAYGLIRIGEVAVASISS